MGEGVQQRGDPHRPEEAGAGGERPEALSAEEMDSRADALAWLAQNRRMSKGYERLPESGEAGDEHVGGDVRN
jgi:hypothetical protein